MSRPTDELPERLLAGAATELERRVLETARQNKPSPAASARMAKALGLTTGVALSVATAKTLAADAAAAKATAAASASTIWPWISTGVLALVVAGAVVGARARRAAAPAETTPHAATVQSPQARQSPDPIAGPTERDSPPNATAPTRRSRAVVPASELRDQIAFVDAARAALAAEDGRRALNVLRRYQDRYPTGSFGPEATALTVEALMKVGRETEARALAERFVVEHRGSLLAARVSEIAGLTKR
jgi:hypothetical protein